MFFERMNNLRRTLAFRLTLWYAGVFVLSAGIAFILFYLSIRSVIYQRVDENLRVQTNEFATVYALRGSEFLQRAALLQAQAVGERKMFFRFLYTSGVVFSSSNMFYWKTIGIDRRAVEAVLGGQKQYYATYTVKDRKQDVRVLYKSLGSSVIIQLGYSLESENQTLQAFRRLFIFSMSVMLAGAMVAGWFMARRALSGVATLTRTAQQISENDLEARVPVRRQHDEIDRLAHTFNQMLDRIQRLVVGIRRMNDNIAHDLRSPIARIRGLAEVTLTGTSDRTAYNQMAANTIEESDRLLAMINTMLTISSTEAGIGPQERLPVDFTTVVRQACDLFQPLAEDKRNTLTCRCDETVQVSGDQGMLQRMVANLIDNAIKYTDPEGRITVELTTTANHIRLVVSDTGIGISPEDQPLVFQRFFRGDQSRSEKGAGLGLSLAQAVAVAHGGTIAVKSHPGQGSVFTVNLPMKD